MHPRKIPLLDMHKELGASIGEFANYQTVISYGSVIEEHLSVRNDVGIFDISHMTMILLKGKNWLETIDNLVPKKVANLKKGVILGPTVFLNESAGIKDDILVYPLFNDEFLIVGNAINLQKDVEWLEKNAPINSEIELLNDEYSLIAIQGPRSQEVVSSLISETNNLGKMAFLENIDTVLGGIRLVSRSGWTGEDGFELIVRNDIAEKIYRYFINMNVRPCGLASRDTLRLEMGFLLYGQDMNEDITPIDARYWYVFDNDKQNCIGCNALRETMKKGARQVRVGLRFKKGERTIPRTGSRVMALDEEVGYITSGGYSPILERPIAMAYVKPSHALMGMTLNVEIRGKRLEAKVVDFPFITK